VAEQELDLVEKFERFFQINYQDEILKKSGKDDAFLKIEFPELSMFDLSLAEHLLEEPDETVEAASMALETFDTTGYTLNPRFCNLPSSTHLPIREARSKHLNKLYQYQGIVKQKNDVRPQLVAATFSCPRCETRQVLQQTEKKLKTPRKCGDCGWKGSFNLVKKQLQDVQKLVLEEAPEELTGGEQPKRVNVFLKDDLVSPISEKRTNPGSKISLVGVLKEVPVNLSSGAKSTSYDLIIEGNYVEPIQEEFSDLEIDTKERDEIIQASKDPKVYEKLVESIAPTIYGHDRIKEALTLQLFGGCRKNQGEGIKRRGDIHILLIGDPGAGKSQLLKRVSHVAPKSRFVSGKGATGAGLTASVVKDEFLKGWALEAGALVLANKGIACIDELDKMSQEDASAMHEALEQQSITISKANIQATLKSETTVLAAANPKYGRFDPYDVIAKQIEMPSTLINRFDLIFPIRDIPDRDKDNKLASFILDLHRDDTSKNAPYETDFLKRYIAFSKQRVEPQLTDEALEEIRDYFVQMRDNAGKDDKIQSIPISARQLEGLVRLSEASAKTRLSAKVERSDAERAVDLLHYCLQQIGYDEETGEFDIDKIETGVTASQRSQISIIKQIINELEKSIGDLIPMEDVFREAEEKEIDEHKAEEIIQKLKQKGDIYQPKSGYISKI
jgi:replicative DNA helicase Mcm